MKISRIPHSMLSISLLLLVFLAVGCPELEEITEPTNNNGNTELPSDPGPGNLAGKVIGTINRQPLGGVQVKVNGKSTNTLSDGTFLLIGVGSGSFGVEISGNLVYTRLAAINTNTAGRSVLLDAIEMNSSFHLGFYREIARGNHPDEKNIYPTHRWVSSTPPTFYIDTDASVTEDGVIDTNQINAAINVIKTVVPVFSGNTYSSSSVSIVLKPFYYLDFGKDIPDNSFVISFSDQIRWLFSAYGATITDPSIKSYSTSSINKAVIRVLDNMSYYARGGFTFEEILAHEMGHGFGFQHTSLLPSVMVATDVFGGLFSEMDRLHMAIVYNRPAGNRDIDNDPIPGAKHIGSPVGRQVFVDRGEIRLTPEEIARLQALPNDKIPAGDLELMRNSMN